MPLIPGRHRLKIRSVSVGGGVAAKIDQRGVSSTPARARGSVRALSGGYALSVSNHPARAAGDVQGSSHIDGEREIVVPYRTRARGSEVSVGPVECPAVAFRRPRAW
jgi:hypothetical protein